MAENQYPVSRQRQIDLMRECLSDAREIAQEFTFSLQVACSLFSYRIEILSNIELGKITHMPDEEEDA